MTVNSRHNTMKPFAMVSKLTIGLMRLSVEAEYMQIQSLSRCDKEAVAQVDTGPNPNAAGRIAGLASTEVERMGSSAHVDFRSTLEFRSLAGSAQVGEGQHLLFPYRRRAD